MFENPMNSMKSQNDRILKEKLPRLVGAQYATGDQWRNNSRKNEGMEPKQKQYPAVDVTGDKSKIWCCKEQYCIGTWNVRSKNKGKLEVVKQEMARVSMWVWVNSGSWWWTGRPGVLRFMGSQRVGHNWATELNWTELNLDHQARRVVELLSFIFLSKILIFIYLAALSPSCSMQDLQLQHVGASFLTKYRIWAPCIGNMGS